MKTPTTPHNQLLSLFTRSPVAANLVMIAMIVFGIIGLSRINTTFFPSFNIRTAVATTVWAGATTEDIEQLITNRIEQNLTSISSIKELSSSSSEGVSVIIAEFYEDSDYDAAYEEFKQEIEQITDFPEDAETPTVRRVNFLEDLAQILIVGDDLDDLRVKAENYKDELLDLGISQIAISGEPQEEIAIQISSDEIRRYGVPLNQLANQIAQYSADLPAGVVGRSDSSQQIRFTQQRRDVLNFESLPVLIRDGQQIALGDIATIERRNQRLGITMAYQGRPAILLTAQRLEAASTLDSAEIIEKWYEKTSKNLEPDYELIIFGKQYDLLIGRINLLLKNGFTGLILVVGVLLLFMTARTTLWVAVGIPTAFLATMGVFYFIGGTINMISLFALIMAVGIVVDEAIVVSENSMTNYRRTGNAFAAAEEGAARMFWPVSSAALTTIGAFLPLLMVGGIIGKILKDIPIVIICVLIASLVEAFLVLPGHLSHSFQKADAKKDSRFRIWFDTHFREFRDVRFRGWVEKSLKHWALTLLAALVTLILSIGMLAGGVLKFEFFPQDDGTTIAANVAFTAGTQRRHVKEFLDQVEQALLEVEAETEEDIVITEVVMLGSTYGQQGDDSSWGDHYGSIIVELTEPDLRKSMRNFEILKRWREKIPQVGGLESFNIVEFRGGPPGADVDLALTGGDATTLKRAATDIIAWLNRVGGVNGANDNLAYGQPQRVLSLSPSGSATGISVADIGSQLRAAYQGVTIQTFADNQRDVDVNLSLADEERDSVNSLSYFPVVLPNNSVAPLESIVTGERRPSFDTIRHRDGKLNVSVTASVDPLIANSNEIRAQMAEELLPDIRARYGINVEFKGRAEDQAQTLGDMLTGVVMGLVLIYIVLAAIFSSYSWPILVMSIIPLGLVGAIWGHLLMGLDLTILSLFGLFGLSGIVVNDSIVLVTTYREIKNSGAFDNPFDAIVEAACQRLRAVLLTSITTIFGLVPILFETSLQASFLKPMATSIAAGLFFGTIIVLILVPTQLYIFERFSNRNRLVFSKADNAKTN